MYPARLVSVHMPAPAEAVSTAAVEAVIVLGNATQF